MAHLSEATIGAALIERFQQQSLYALDHDGLLAANAAKPAREQPRLIRTLEALRGRG